MLQCRHDNDYTTIADIAIAPTQEEVLCQVAPYLPANQPGTVLHLESGSQEAHRDLHFRYKPDIKYLAVAWQKLLALCTHMPLCIRMGLP